MLRTGGRLSRLPPPRNRGLPRLRNMMRKSGKPDLRWGRVGEGGREFWQNCCLTSRPPPPTPPHKGEGSRPCALLVLCINITETGISVHFVCLIVRILLVYRTPSKVSKKVRSCEGADPSPAATALMPHGRSGPRAIQPVASREERADRNTRDRAESRRSSPALRHSPPA